MNVIFNENCKTGLKRLPDNSIHTCVTSPDYFNLRDYGYDNQIGWEETPRKYIESLLEVFSEVKRVLRNDGTIWVNIGDSYNGSGKANGDKNLSLFQSTNKASHETPPTRVSGLKQKDLIGIPWMLAFALRDELGLYLRDDIIWHKPNAMPESVTDRCTKSYEHIFLLSKCNSYYFDHKAIMEEAAYNGRKDTRMKGSHKYPHAVTGLNPQTFAARGHERWVMVNGKYMRNKRNATCGS